MRKTKKDWVLEELEEIEKILKNVKLELKDIFIEKEKNERTIK